MRAVPVSAFCAAVVITLMTACHQSSNATGNGDASPANLDKWSWLPASHAHDAELAQVSNGAQIQYFIPKDEPLDAKSNGWGGIDSEGNFVPSDKNGYTVNGGALVSTLGSILKKAKWGDWDFVYSDAARMTKAGWGVCLTSGEILLPRNIFLDPPADRFVQNSFSVEAFGSDYVLVRIDPTKGQRLCFLQLQGGKIPTAGYIGSKAEVNGKTLERKANGWYSGSIQFSH